MCSQTEQQSFAFTVVITQDKNDEINVLLKFCKFWSKNDIFYDKFWINIEYSVCNV